MHAIPRQGSARRHHGIVNPTVIDVYITRTVCVNYLGSKFKHDSFNVPHDIEQSDFVHPIVRIGQQSEFLYAEFIACAPSGGFSQGNFADVVGGFTRADAVGHDKGVDARAFRAMPGQGRATTENFIIRMGGNH